MSRSYKKHPSWSSDGSAWKRYSKRQASKAVRRSTIVADGRFYKKLYNSYDIVDYKYVWFSERELEKEWLFNAHKMRAK